MDTVLKLKKLAKLKIALDSGDSDTIGRMYCRANGFSLKKFYENSGEDAYTDALEWAESIVDSTKTAITKLN
jgi:hypothetical protein